MKKISLILLITLILSACSNTANVNENSLKIVTSFYPVMLMTKAIVSDTKDVEVTNLASPNTGCLHDYSLSPKDMKTLEKADVLIVNGLGMESFINKVTSSLPNLKIINLSEGIPAIGGNAHIWLSPDNAAIMSDNLAVNLSKIDSKNSATYMKNSDDFNKKLYNLNEKMQSSFKDVKNRDIVVFDDAFYYLTANLGLNVKAVIDSEPGEEPSPSELKKTIDVVKNSKVNIIFVDSQYNASAAETVSAETNAKIYTLDPIVNGKNSDKPDEFIKRMNENFNVLNKALNQEN